MEPVLKTGDAARHRGFKSLSLRQVNIVWRSTQVAIRGSPAKGVGWVTGAWVQIPPSPPKQKRPKRGVFALAIVLWGFEATTAKQEKCHSVTLLVAG